MAATRIHAAEIDLAGRGFGGNSPLLDILRFAYQAQAIASSASEHTAMTVQSATANATQLLEAQKAREEGYKASEDVFARLNEALLSLTGQLYSATTGMIGQIGS